MKHHRVSRSASQHPYQQADHFVHYQPSIHHEFRSSEQNEFNPFFRSISLGILSAMRSMASPAWVTRSSSKTVKRIGSSALILEMFMDKMPFTPNRITPPQLIARATLAGVSSLHVNRGSHSVTKRMAGAITGAITAILATYATFHLRKKLGQTFKKQLLQWAPLGKRLKNPDILVGLAEDILTMGLGALFFRFRASHPLSPSRTPQLHPSDSLE